VPLSKPSKDNKEDIELLLLPRALEREKEIRDIIDDLIEPFSEAKLTNYSEENSGIRGLDD
jgi:hypothetical protein